ncbi:unnamed protein product, partial [Echinostoma caproni]|uniref:EGF-like domain-containing protein n=1 Tax=Echinostoma caproni TaxID=27848 RepID=A0A183BFB4_9TREM
MYICSNATPPHVRALAHRGSCHAFGLLHLTVLRKPVRSLIGLDTIRIRFTDACTGIKCHENGFCQDGRCYCRDGFEGDGYWECRPRVADPCANVTCSENAFCRAGHCECDSGYQMDSYGRCVATSY